MSRLSVSPRIDEYLAGHGSSHRLAALGAGAVIGAALAIGLLDHGWTVRAAGLVAGGAFLLGGTVAATFLRTYSLQREITSAVDATAGALWGLSGLLRGTGQPLPALGGYALRPLAAHGLARAVAERRPEIVVELGPGASTVIVELAARQQDPTARIFSLEHDDRYVAEMEGLVRSLDLAGTTVIHAPLRDRDGTAWYDDAALQHVPSAGIDLLIVDGPPDPNGTGTRRHAYPRLRDRLSGGAIIFVDDTLRPAERRMVNEWLRDPRLRMQRDGGSYVVLVHG